MCVCVCVCVRACARVCVCVDVLERKKSQFLRKILQQLCPWMTLTCDGFILLLSGNPNDAYNKFVESLDKIKNMAGSSASPHQAIADNFNYMGLAAYEADMKVESLRYWRR